MMGYSAWRSSLSCANRRMEDLFRFNLRGESKIRHALMNGEVIYGEVQPYSTDGGIFMVNAPDGEAQSILARRADCGPHRNKDALNASRGRFRCAAPFEIVCLTFDT